MYVPRAFKTNLSNLQKTCNLRTCLLCNSKFTLHFQEKWSSAESTRIRQFSWTFQVQVMLTLNITRNTYKRSRVLEI